MSRTRHFRLCRVLPLVLLLACGQDATGVELPSPAVDAGPEQRVVLGTGWRAFEPREIDEHVTLVAGPQGAHHVWVSFRSYGFDTDVLRMSLSTGWDDEPDVRQLAQGNVAARPIVDEQGESARVTLGWPSVVPDPLCQDGRALRFDLGLSNPTQAGSDSRRWILDVPPELRPSECAAPAE